MDFIGVEWFEFYVGLFWLVDLGFVYIVYYGFECGD